MTEPTGHGDELTAEAARAAARYVSLAMALKRRVNERRTVSSHAVADAATALRKGRSAEGVPARGGQPAGAVRQDGAAALSTTPATATSAAGRYVAVVQQALDAVLATAVLADPGWPSLAGHLAEADQRGVDPARLLRAAAAQREMATARRPALLLAHRLGTLPPSDAAADADPALVARRSFPAPLSAGAPNGSGPTSSQPQPPALPAADRRKAERAPVVAGRGFPTRLVAVLRGGERRARGLGTGRQTRAAAARRSWVLLLPARPSRGSGRSSRGE